MHPCSAHKAVDCFVLRIVVRSNETCRAAANDGLDGCWTNIGEARTYAEDKLSELGYEVRDDDEKVNVRMKLSINSQRNGDKCLGSISV